MFDNKAAFLLLIDTGAVVGFSLLFSFKTKQNTFTKIIFIKKYT